jgi:hypothetical protein
MGEWKYNPTVLDLGITERCVRSFAPLPLYLWGKSCHYILEQEVVWALNTTEKSSAPPRNGSPISQLLL